MGDINKIAVLYGGSSSEREISIQSGEGVYKAIIELGYITELIDINDLEDLSELKVFDFIFIALHGFEGEGGKLQEDLDDLNILYSGSNSKACRNTWNKRLTKEILEKNNIRTPVWLEVKFNKTIVDNGLRLSLFDRFRPFEYLFLKPQEDGSSVDIFKISDEESLRAAYKKCTNPNRDFLFEEYIHGREITVTVIDKECFPPIEIITKNEFYDYDAKYISDDTLHVEAKLTQNELDEIKLIAINAFEALDCKAWARVDLIQDKKGNFYVIEINTVPGMTSHSNVPKSGSLLGFSYNEVVEKIIDASL
jgi:D-alanine-D-alanine ligase